MVVIKRGPHCSGGLSIYAGLREVRDGGKGVNPPFLILTGEDKDVHKNPNLRVWARLWRDDLVLTAATQLEACPKWQRSVTGHPLDQASR